MRVTIFGFGYVGLVTGACLAKTDNDVLPTHKEAASEEKIHEVGGFFVGFIY